MLAAAALLLCAAPNAGATTSFMWTGGSGTNWSTAANWGGTAPAAADGTVDLTFPGTACTPACATTTDDIANLTVGTLTLANKVVASSGGPPPPPQSPSSYSVTGSQALTLTGGIDVVTSSTGSGTGVSSSPMDVSVPIVLGADNSWSLGADSSLGMPDAITGAHALNVALAGSFGMQSVEVGPLTITGSGGAAGVFFGAPGVDGDLNGTSGQPVNLSHVFLEERGTTGPLTFSDGYLLVGIPGFGGQLHTTGALTLSGATSVEFDEPPPGASSPEITTAGAANLGSATLRIAESCPSPGTVFTLVQAQGGISGVFTDLTGAPITNGETIQPAAGSCGSSSSPLPLRIDYAANAVTATVLSSAASSQQSSSSASQQPLANPSVPNPYPGPGPTSPPAPLTAGVDAGRTARELLDGMVLFSRRQRHAHSSGLLTSRGAALSFTGLESGVLQVHLVDRSPAPAHTGRAVAAATTIARGAQRVGASGRAAVTLRATPRGKLLLRRARRQRRSVKLLLAARLVPASGTPISRTLAVRLRP
ncbi:MAG: hypothetical protein E6G56_05895 [Actinobacteria bacterium]|nr:MAG: hypothetical protein E6G56_05895 [Actinomycetota bacterium]